MSLCYGLLPLLLLQCLNLPLGYADSTVSPQRLLQQMVEASRLSDYELICLRPHQAGIESWRYRHAVIHQQSVAQLLALEGHPTEVQWQGNIMSYARQDPSSVPNDTIYEVLPRVMQADIKRLCAYYDFSLLSTDRVADRDCQVIRLMPKDTHRYGYVVWLDSQSKLLLRADLLTPDGQQIEQFRVVALSQGAPISQTLRRAKIAPRTVLPIVRPSQQRAITTWQPGWLPPGFERQFSGQRSLPSHVEPVEAELYSDGLLTVALYVHATRSEIPPKPLALQEQSCSVYSEVRSGREITVLGEIPLSSARRMAQQMIVNTP